MAETTGQVKQLFELWFDNPQINKAARIITGRLINEYGYEKVEEAFLEAATKEQYKLAYVRGILKRQAEKMAVQKKIYEAHKLKKETEAISKQPTKIGGFDFSELLYKNKPTKENNLDDYKKTDAYKKAKQDFENNLNGEK